ncbi:MAG: Ig-like domain-containing protein [Acidobacteriota bacterium]
MSKLSTAALVLLAALAAASGGACRRADATRPDVPADRVTITTPQDQAMFDAGDDITVEAAVETSEPVQRVEFWSNGGVMRTLDRPPFRMTIPKAGAGSFRIHAIAHTAHGKIASQQVYVGVRLREEDRMRELTVEESAALIGGVEPHIFINAPTSDQTFKAPANITIDGWVAFPAAAIKQISVVADSRPLTTVTTPTFTHVWERVPQGRHTIVIQAMDAEGRTSTRTVILDVR